jgi:hypothetical protein
MRPMLRLHAYGLSALLIVAAGYPLLLDPHDGDDFPSSTYPMFADDRGRVATVVRAVAIDGSGAERLVPAEVIANQEPMQALSTVRRAVRGGGSEAGALCGAIAGRLTQGVGGSALAAAKYVELQTVKVDSIAYLGGNPEPVSRHVHARCPLQRSP